LGELAKGPSRCRCATDLAGGVRWRDPTGKRWHRRGGLAEGAGGGGRRKAANGRGVGAGEVVGDAGGGVAGVLTAAGRCGLLRCWRQAKSRQRELSIAWVFMTACRQSTGRKRLGGQEHGGTAGACPRECGQGQTAGRKAITPLAAAIGCDQFSCSLDPRSWQFAGLPRDQRAQRTR